MHFEVYCAQDAEARGHNRWRWRLRAANGEIVADGSEGYDSPSNARRAIRMVQDAVLSAEGEMDVVDVDQ